MAVSTDLVEQALGNLVKQFAHPMDCLRELVQNSIDAGTPRIEIEVRYTAPADGLNEGVLEIEVADFGQGMDEQIIETQLTRLFSSAKEGDLASIGKFGIGFTSIFAIDPALVRVTTGRHGENWELLFHEDRSFERRRYDGVVQGTTVTLYKRLQPARVGEVVADARDTLIRWCEHAETPISFLDRTLELDGKAEESVGSEDFDDPFAAFGSVTRTETLNRPFGLDDSALQVQHRVGDVEAMVGFCPETLWGFFSGGLTLLRSRDPGHLGPYHKRLAHLSFKVRSPRIEHTLTRDNVIQDEAWHEAMEVVVAAAHKLRAQLETHISQLAEQGGEVAEWHGYLAQDLPHGPIPLDVPLFIDLGGKARTLAQVAPLGPFGREAWLIDSDEAELGMRLWRRGLKILPFHPDTEALLRAALPGHRVDDAASAFKLTRSIAPDELDEGERAFFASVASHVGVATGNGLRVGVCEIEAGDVGGTLYVEGQAAEGLFRRPAKRGVRGMVNRAWKQLSGVFMLQRYLRVNRLHPHVRQLIQRSEQDVDFGGFVLAQALLVDQGYDTDTFEALGYRAAREWVADV